MRWEALFGDLEAQWRAEERLELDAEVAERTRAERARVLLGDRLAAQRGASLVLALTTGRTIAGVLRDLGADQLVAAGDREVLVPLGAVASLTGVRRSVRPGDPARRFPLGTALRAFARDRSTVALTVLPGTVLTGTVDAVHADHLQFAEHPVDEPRRTANVRAVRLVALPSIVAVENLAGG